jgi:enoyl-CoA hydratase/carnithine racemase
MQDTQILLNYRDSIAFITLNRPEARNAINLELARALLNVAMECDGNPCAGYLVRLFSKWGLTPA